MAIIDLSPASLATSKYLVLLLLEVLEYSASRIVEPNELVSQIVTGEEQEQALDMIGTCSLCPVVLLLMLLNCLLAMM